jgi:predicted membrane channel-forming protein YqfA (hemolysin III family)
MIKFDYVGIVMSIATTNILRTYLGLYGQFALFVFYSSFTSGCAILAAVNLLGNGREERNAAEYRYANLDTYFRGPTCP